MKTLNRLNPAYSILFLFITALFWGGCTSGIQIQVLQPATINVPEELKVLGLLNRYKPEASKGLQVLEGILTGENIGQDRRGADASLGGLTNALAGSPRFRITRPAFELEGTGRAVFPDPLPLDMVKKICTDFSCNALVTIEAFDSNTDVTFKTEVREKKNKEGAVEKFTVHLARKRLLVTVGWRMYHGQKGTLIDEYRMVEEMYFTGEGPSQDAAVRNLPGKEQIVQDLGRITGDKYATRIAPRYIWVQRDYYTRGSDNLKLAKRDVKTNNWDGAMDYWEAEIASPKKEKTAARAAYNMAVVSEVYGDLNKAQEWLQEAGGMGLRTASDYAGIIQRRIWDQQRLDEQMKGAPK